jgi:nitrous oxidase accessory protein
MTSRERRSDGVTRRSRKLRLAALVAGALAGAFALGACRHGSDAFGLPAPPTAARATPSKPACVREVRAGEPVQAALDAVADGAAVCLGPGTHAGPLVIRHPLVLWGPHDAVVKSTGVGTTIDVQCSRVEVLGITVDGSGARYDLLDSAIAVHGDDVRVQGVEILRAVFGVLVNQSNRIRILDNVIHGTEEQAIGLRGDPIRLWETRDSVISGNRVLAGRDVVVWYSSNNRIENNLVSDGRYGTHLMYAHGNLILGNRYERDVVGVFLMYSRNIRLDKNQFLHAEGAAGMGLGFKESGNVRVRDNAFVNNTVNVFMDNSPLHMGDENVFERNVFALGEVGIDFHSSQHHNLFVDNAFQGNTDHVRVDGNGDALGVTWLRNYFDDYAGYDLDGDGFGDVAHEVRRLSGDLVQRSPQLAFLRGTPALWLADVVSSVAPLFPPRKILSDPRPRMQNELPPAPSEEAP